MRKTIHIFATALFVTGVLLQACTINDSNTAQTVTFTATLAPKGEDPQSKAISTGTEGGKEILNVAWVVGEKISVNYVSDSGPYAETPVWVTATVTAVDPTTGTATISAPLNRPKDGYEVIFIYPATLKPNITTSPETQLLSQHGNLTARTTPNASVDDISTNFDYATGSGTLSVAAGTAVVSSKVTMENEVCICKFHFALDEGNGMNPIGGGEHEFKSFTINDGDGHTYTIESDRLDDGPYAVEGVPRGFRSTDDIYVALLPISGKTVTFSYTETLSSSSTATYSCTKQNVTLEKGKFYRNIGTITMVKQ